MSIVIASPNNLPFKIRDYEFLKLVGRGGFAEVYLVKSIKYNSEYVAKVITMDSQESDVKSKTFESEIEILSKLNHSNVIRLYDHFVEGRQSFMIIEYCPQGSLRNEICKAKPRGLERDRFIVVAKQMVDALAYCHSNDIAHRDIKPDNVLFSDTGVAKLGDFGLSLQVKDTKIINTFGGSTIYSSPEIHFKRPHDPFMADIWALGVTFHVMLCGEPPFEYDTLGMLKNKIAQEKFVWNKRIPGDIIELLKNMLRADPKERITIKQISLNHIFAHTNPIPIPRPLSGQRVKPAPGWNTIDKGAIDGKSRPVHTASSFLIHTKSINPNIKPRIRSPVVSPFVYSQCPKLGRNSLPNGIDGDNSLPPLGRVN